MLKAVVDTSVFIAGLISKNGSPRRLINAINEVLFIPVTSEAIIKELIDVAPRPKFRHLINPMETSALVKSLYRHALFVEPSISLKAVPADSKDDMFLEAALTGHAKFVISVDNHLLDLFTYDDIEIITPSAFLKKLTK